MRPQMELLISGIPEVKVKLKCSIWECLYVMAALSTRQQLLVPIPWQPSTAPSLGGSGGGGGVVRRDGGHDEDRDGTLPDCGDFNQLLSIRILHNFWTSS